MRRRFRTLYLKLSATLLTLLSLLALLQAWRFHVLWNRAAHESVQLINWSLAELVRSELEPAVRDGIDHLRVEQVLRRLHRVYPEYEFYLLERDGTIAAFFGDWLPTTRVDLDPILTALQPEIPELPLYGTDPRSPQVDRRNIFSVAPILLGGKPGYLYVIMRSEISQIVASQIQLFYSAKSGPTDFLLVLLVTALLGTLSFFVLTRRFERLTAVVERFRKGDLSQRVEDEGNDELGDLAKTFNSMADQIEGYIEQLRQTDEQRRRLIADISHDLRTPLTSLSGYLETVLFEDEKLERGARTRYLLTMQESVETLQHMISDLFELARLEAKEKAPKLGRCSLTRVAHRLVLAFEPAAEEKDLVLESALPPGTPDVRADAEMIERLLSNLISNAIRYTLPGGAITLGATVEGDNVVIYVRDSGVGIPEEDLPHIFDRFYRVEKDRSSQTGGTGLGLAIVKRIAEAHDAEISIASERGVGTTIYLTLVRYREEDVQSAEAGAREP